MGPSPSPCELDCAKLVKLMREARLLDSTLTSVDVDVTFCQVKEKGERRITFLQFLDLVCMLGTACDVGASCCHPGCNVCLRS